jgi:hypothetical protein
MVTTGSIGSANTGSNPVLTTKKIVVPQGNNVEGTSTAG